MRRTEPANRRSSAGDRAVAAIFHAALCTLFIACLCAGAGCAVSHAPPGWLDAPGHSRAFGGWIVVERLDGPEQLRGELISIEADSLLVLDDLVLVSLPLACVSKADLTGYAASSGIASWTVLGTLSTASHGFLLLLSAPVWLVAGISASAAETHAPHFKHPPSSWEALRPFARFPQGMPPGLSRTSLRPKVDRYEYK
jgi:hypothetical protein